ncbi:peptidoglycan-binding domain-containing protein [Sulfitobacter sp. D35]|uniref:peptidoglycan-binding domain-containing protein n=1 Tax=Sulfitobacter sp. D35 TaxID=3083252 RepID=UPI00296E9C4D|nr:peptidoglycan-binding domain-containing protein [Sulfitobacter sp. D35]MDW4497405.1 peptidoglycan-binding domain-containing protein [Sulfitobacter sp. D35]
MTHLTRRAVIALLVLSPAAAHAGASISRKDGSAYSPNLVRAVQRALSERGYDPGPDDGVMGPRTADAIYAFRAAEGLEQRDELDDPLLIALGLAQAPDVPEASQNAPDSDGDAGS